MKARHLRGRARSYDLYRGVSGARLDGALVQSGSRVFPWIERSSCVRGTTLA